MTAFIIIGAVLILLVIWFIVCNNGLVTLRNMVLEAFSTMDVYMKKRFDLIPNLIESVKGYMAHEKSTLDEIVKLRTEASEAKETDINKKVQADAKLSGAITNLFALAEAYPNLKADTQFTALQEQLGNIENEIAESRKYYNAVVRKYNTKIQTIPSNIVAAITGHKEYAYYELPDNAQRENVKVSF